LLDQSSARPSPTASRRNCRTHVFVGPVTATWRCFISHGLSSLFGDSRGFSVRFHFSAPLSGLTRRWFSPHDLQFSLLTPCLSDFCRWPASRLPSPRHQARTFAFSHAVPRAASLAHVVFPPAFPCALSHRPLSPVCSLAFHFFRPSTGSRAAPGLRPVHALLWFLAWLFPHTVVLFSSLLLHLLLSWPFPRFLPFFSVTVFRVMSRFASLFHGGSFTFFVLSFRVAAYPSLRPGRLFRFIFSLSTFLALLVLGRPDLRVRLLAPPIAFHHVGTASWALRLSASFVRRASPFLRPFPT